MSSIAFSFAVFSIIQNEKKKVDKFADFFALLDQVIFFIQ